MLAAQLQAGREFHIEPRIAVRIGGDHVLQTVPRARRQIVCADERVGGRPDHFQMREHREHRLRGQHAARLGYRKVRNIELSPKKQPGVSLRNSPAASDFRV